MMICSSPHCERDGKHSRAAACPTSSINTTQVSARILAKQGSTIGARHCDLNF
jgi:hypothetical protein